MTPTEEFINALQSLGPGDLAALRRWAGQPPDESVAAFDLFTGLWWPLRRKNQRAPRREVAWLAAKLFAFRPLPPRTGVTLAAQLGGLAADEGKPTWSRLQSRFDRLLAAPLNLIEAHLQQAISMIAARWSGDATLDWVALVDDLSRWEGEEIREEWARQYLAARDPTFTAKGEA